MKLKQILKKYIINNIGYKVLAIVFAFLLWVVILNNTDPEYTRTIPNIPVKIINEQAILDGTHVYTIASGDITSVIVTGKRSIISSLLPADFLVTADFKELSITNAVPIKAELTGDKSRYSSLVTVNPKDTSMLVNLENMTSKQIQVEVEYRGDLPDHIVVDEANVFPKKVTLSAPESITDSAEKVVVVADARLIKSDMDMVLDPVIRGEGGTQIKQEGDVSIDIDQIQAEFKVSNTKDVPIVVNVSGRLRDGLKFEGLELSQDTIMVKGPESSIRNLNRVVIPNSVIDLGSAAGNFDVTIDVTPYLPDDITVYGESPLVTAHVLISGTENKTQTDDPVPEENHQEPDRSGNDSDS